MAKEYKDQILDTSVNEKRVYNIVDSDGNIVAENVSLEDKTVYSQEGTEFGAQEVNEIYEAIDEVNQSLKGIPIEVTPIETFGNTQGDLYLNNGFLMGSLYLTGYKNGVSTYIPKQTSFKIATIPIRLKNQVRIQARILGPAFSYAMGETMYITKDGDILVLYADSSANTMRDVFATICCKVELDE